MAGHLQGQLHPLPDDDLQEHHEINVTPFIDVMLVLLIIFMVAAPLAAVDIDVELPATSAGDATPVDAPLFITITAEQKLMVGAQPVEHSSLISALDNATGGDVQTRIFLRADRSTDYDVLLQIINLLRGANYLKVALVGVEGAPG